MGLFCYEMFFWLVCSRFTCFQRPALVLRRRFSIGDCHRRIPGKIQYCLQTMAERSSANHDFEEQTILHENHIRLTVSNVDNIQPLRSNCHMNNALEGLVDNLLLQTILESACCALPSLQRKVLSFH